MSISEMKYYVASAYPGYNWKNKVVRMNEQQLFAIFNRLKDAGKIKIESPYVKQEQRTERENRNEEMWFPF